MKKKRSMFPTFAKIITIFSELSLTNQMKYNIKTIDEIPHYTSSNKYPFVHKQQRLCLHKQQVQRQIYQMLEDRSSSSPWVTPICMVPKKPDTSGKQK